MRVGIMGGTLDPVHNGHLQLAQAALQMLNLDRVMLLPAGDPPHKAKPTSKMDRLEMARLAAAEIDGVFPCSIEIFRSGTTYTVDSLRQLRENNPAVEWFYIIGADTLEVLDTWRNFHEVARMCTFVVTGRADADINSSRIAEFENQYGARFITLPFNGPDISSTDIRSRIARGEDTSGLMPASVSKYIAEHGLYLSNRSLDAIKQYLRQNLKPARFDHTISVAETARALAPRYGVNSAKAYLAGILHDCAKYLPLNQLRSMVKENIPDADEHEMAAVSVLHAPAGAVLAREEFGVQDGEILSSIRKHTIGDAHMSALDALIYTADFIEPLREDFPGLSQARSLAQTDLFAAMCKCASLTNSHLESQGRHPHPRSLAMLNNYQSNQNKEESK